jgi:hypothetical protein
VHNRPLEDYGDFWGCQHLLEVLFYRANPEHAEQIEWICEDCDPKLTIEIAGTMLAAAFNGKNQGAHQFPRPFCQTQQIKV